MPRFHKIFLPDKVSQTPQKEIQKQRPQFHVVERGGRKYFRPHRLYTGTCFWVDPDNQIIYIFLSNRVYPSRTHTQLMELNIRPRIQDVIYEAIRLK